jgi:hypothetical protein
VPATLCPTELSTFLHKAYEHALTAPASLSIDALLRQLD